LLRFAAVTDHEGALRCGKRALETVLETLCEDGHVTHYEGEDSESGLLVDHARLLSGLSAAAQVGGPDGWIEPARRVADDALGRLVAADGSFRDGDPSGQGLLDRPLYPLGTNAEMADGLLDLAALTGEKRYADAAEDALAAFAGAYDRMGVEAAGYATACARAHYDPLVVRTPPAGLISTARRFGSPTTRRSSSRATAPTRSSSGAARRRIRPKRRPSCSNGPRRDPARSLGAF